MLEQPFFEGTRLRSFPAFLVLKGSNMNWTSLSDKELVYIILPFAFFTIVVWAIRSDAREATRMGKKVLSALGDKRWELDLKGRMQRSLPFCSSLPDEAVSSRAQKPFLSLDTESLRAWLFGNVMFNMSTSSVVGDKVMVVIELPNSNKIGIRIEWKAGDRWREVLEDDRFSILTSVNDGRKWWLCATEETAEAKKLVQSIFSLGIPDEIYFMQILDGYLIVSSKTKHWNVKNYINAWHAAEELYGRILSECPGFMQGGKKSG